jgi:hypothetical protein
MVASVVAGVDPTKLGCTHPLRWLPFGAEGSAFGVFRGRDAGYVSGDEFHGRVQFTSAR